MTLTLKLSLFVVLVCILLSLKQSVKPVFKLTHVPVDVTPLAMDYDFYSKTCPSAKLIVHSTFQELYEKDKEIAPAIIRMIFHDCFVHGCDASILLESGDGIQSEKDKAQNQFLRRFEVIDTIKARLEERCPRVVSCADILALAARESTSGFFYPLKTGRRDSTSAFPNETVDLPSPFGTRSDAVALFARKGFTEQELVVLLGAHSTGQVHCPFVNPRLHNFTTDGGPGPSIDPAFLEILRATCNGSLASSQINTSSSNISMRMDFEGIGQNFGTLYYRSLLQGRGLTFLDQQMTSTEETERMVNAFALDSSEFQKEFTDAMVKLSNLQVLTAPIGQIRLNCRKVNS